ncbi:Rieske (2Fe-2S) protein [Pseudomonas citronellolis]|uniref:Rieske (2Fe-2S) protein n=1 Tax=Pseudomonas citronellolis TaxID=53408 RepID=UPI000E2EEE9B|nr:Rieske 2Fe-2S domain-containing protein [Pseudomonas citronellolis]MCP1608064.1 nitrite reductase/ring-hydroxylating ferredoxin subunit [Pseudomonas citronellolis]MCP1658872.1 nitrite reductase/ring-hydroxylating ferredoxin subunit [Pseudomonas citronellolis]MCP1725801.1 nitrite reductase/ring-hydroxylating ferredoxin subunit [Pseudomonas citronellolis]MDN6874824.1 Rieske 2Fe-2S domain-containing protein [Pseudomonas citronellolis]UXJ55322.1 Rieske (2Fe-2S) protein [Pseudomonas citronelloli
MSRLVVPREKLPGEGGRRLFFLAGHSVLLFNVEGQYFAIDDGCPHAGASLFSGKLQGRWLQCPAHGLRFDLASGCAAGAAGLGVRHHPIEWDGDTCIVVISDSAPEELPA